jgi:hypothetical protein
MPRSPHPPRLNYSNNAWRSVQIMKLFIMKFSSFPCHLISLRSKYPSQHPVFKHLPVYVPPLMLETKFHTHTEQQAKL